MLKWKAVVVFVVMVLITCVSSAYAEPDQPTSPVVSMSYGMTDGYGGVRKQVTPDIPTNGTSGETVCWQKEAFLHCLRGMDRTFDYGIMNPMGQQGLVQAEQLVVINVYGGVVNVVKPSPTMMALESDKLETNGAAEDLAAAEEIQAEKTTSRLRLTWWQWVLIVLGTIKLGEYIF